MWNWARTSGFRQGRGCIIHAWIMDQSFAVKQVCEKYLANGKNWAFIYLEKAYDTISGHGMWPTLRVSAVLQENC